MRNEKLLLKIFLCIALLDVTVASYGDVTPFFSNCKINCRGNKCSDDGIEILPHSKEHYKQTIFDKLLQWSCEDECQYHCMWKTVKAFLDRNWNVPQFYGKWPFIRIFGLQEPASVLFSVLNIATNFYLLLKFRKEVRRDTPCCRIWKSFYIVCINGWIWSTVFHARDFPATELLDYASAYSIVLVTLYSMVMRMIYDWSIIIKGALTVLFISFYINYFAYLSAGQINYSDNMKVNIITGILGGFGWIFWCALVYAKRPYFWKILLFYTLFGLSMTLELLDFPPILWTFDAHSLWHLSSIPLSFLFYSFIRDDCKALRLENNQPISKS